MLIALCNQNGIPNVNTLTGSKLTLLQVDLKRGFRASFFVTFGKS
jgi:hypothetical protein